MANQTSETRWTARAPDGDESGPVAGSEVDDRRRAGAVFHRWAEQETAQRREEFERAVPYTRDHESGIGRPLPLEKCGRLVVVGIEAVGQFAAEALGRSHEIVAFLDSRALPVGTTLLDRPVAALEAVTTLSFDAALIASSSVGEIITRLRRLGVSRERILLLSEVLDGLVVFGAGAGGLRVWEMVPRKEMIRCFADNDTRKQGTTLQGIPVIAPSEIARTDYRFVIVASMYRKEIETQLRALNIPEEKVLAIDPTLPPVVWRTARRPELLTEARTFFPEFGDDDLERVWSFGQHCAAAAVTGFDGLSLAVGVVLVAAGCRVTAFGATGVAPGRSALGIQAVERACSAEELASVALVVAGLVGAMAGSFRPGQAVIAAHCRTPTGAHRETAHLAFWYSPPREWLRPPAD